ncbi:cryptochrome/photolyase family protein [Methanosalsum natronophilum]|uniref:cryptochrome/photolyase family protein n=1 Tax=Methanosalsum natronophilum TaxID=768733 RepID=UPI002166F04B|nr:deoxyribodipyrimidine photo-lyase [Methanosalsum natronophilum]MCS3924686.1 deoxyribodipyrimidine photo-lyase [Methanosalsum natronophilum]
MQPYHDISLFIFRRDLRLEDNTGLIEALNHSREVIPCFIFDPRQSHINNKYFSQTAFKFMLNSLTDLNSRLNKMGSRLIVLKGLPVDIISKMGTDLGLSAVFMNTDYTPFSIRRDTAISEICDKENMDLVKFHDSLLTVPGDVLSGSGKPYSVFTPFYKKAASMEVEYPRANDMNNYFTDKLELEDEYGASGIIQEQNLSTANIEGGRTGGLRILDSLDSHVDYDTNRDYPYIDSTTHLSPHNKFGTVSIREVYHTISSELGSGHSLIRQLYWRDFYTHLAYHNPHVFGNAFKTKFDNIEWLNDKEHFQRWCSGTTGFPLIDAGMRQLNDTGYMHNRVRMLTASFLTKDLHIDWRWGEKYFASKLIDYDPCVNNGNWQWSASTGSDAQPYFRIFNPWTQQKKFDPECKYIKQWIPELKDTEPGIIHNWMKTDLSEYSQYPKPIVDHARERNLTLSIFKSV